ncbi:MAG: hypothetical protein DSO07_05180 [Thermoproteota archaeon]|nr:MAG: hypothetical protein DSO07_05180 [Candidatus Korarchaeota archaeon]
MENTQNSIDEKIEDIASKLKEYEDIVGIAKDETKEIDKYYAKLVNLIYDMKRIAKIQKGKKDSYSDLQIEFNIDETASVYTPNIHAYLGDISKDCLANRPIFSCLDEKFSDKQAYYDKLMVEFLETLEIYISKVKRYLPDLRRIEQTERDIYTIREIVNNLAIKINKKEQEKEEEEEQEE